MVRFRLPLTPALTAIVLLPALAARAPEARAEARA